MKMLIVAVYDSASELYTPPFFVKTKAEAIRSFADAVNDPKSAFHNHPADYTLFSLGDYDDSSGSFSNHDVTVKLITALECVRKE